MYKAGYFYKSTHVICLFTHESSTIYQISEPIFPDDLAFDHNVGFLFSEYCLWSSRYKWYQNLVGQGSEY